MESSDRSVAEATECEDCAARARYQRAWRMALLMSGALDWGIIIGWLGLLGASIMLGGNMGQLHWIGSAAAAVRIAAILSAGGNVLMGVSDIAAADDPSGSEIFAGTGRLALFLSTLVGVVSVAIWGGVLLSRAL